MLGRRDQKRSDNVAGTHGAHARSLVPDSVSRTSSSVQKFSALSNHAEEVRKLNLQTIAAGVEGP
jgi:hypothetical protein